MGQRATELEKILGQGKWSMSGVAVVAAYFKQLADDLENIVVDADQWEGAAAVAAKGLMAARSDNFLELQEQVKAVQRCLDAANYALDRARTSYEKLPDDSLPDWVPDAVEKALKDTQQVTKIEFGVFSFEPAAAADGIMSLLGNNREQEAAKVLETLRTDVDIHQWVMEQRQFVFRDDGPYPWPRPGFPNNPHPVDDYPNGPASSDPPPGYNPPPAYALTPISVPPWNPPPGTVVNPPVIGDPGGPPYKDGSLDPHNPNPGGGVNPGGIRGGGTGGGGGGSGLVSGLGGAAGALGLGAAAKVGGLGGLGSAGAAARLGGAGAGGLGSSATSGAGASGSRGSGTSNNMMGGGAGGAGGKEKDKRSGLGGLIAPKLEDDEDLGPRSASADAGGRDSD